MKRRIVATIIALVVVMLPAVPVGAQQHQHLKIVIPQSVIDASETSQAPPRNAPPKQSRRNFVSGICDYSACSARSNVTVKYGD